MKPVAIALFVGLTCCCLAMLAGCNDANNRRNRGQALPTPAAPEVVAASAETTAPPLEAEALSEGSAQASEAQDPLRASYGNYVGMFVAEEMDEKKNPMYSNKINLIIANSYGGSVMGRAVIAGTSTPFAGPVTRDQKKGVFNLKLHEDMGKDSGVFTATLDTNTKTISGTWVAGNPQAAVTKRSYQLVKTEFKYDPKRELGETWSQLYTDDVRGDVGEAEAITDAAGKLNASARLLKTKDVENMYQRDLEVVRNAIYARHGYTFRNRQMRYFFDNFIDWYVPVSTDVTRELTDIEQKNIELLKRYEKHADKYYDSYGR